MADNTTYPSLIEKAKETLQMPAWAKNAETVLYPPETVAGTVSSKVEEYRRWGFFNPKCCECAYIKKGYMTLLSPSSGWHPDRMTLLEKGYREYPAQRCSAHRSKLRKWQNAKKVFIRLDELRMNAELEHLRFVTKTRPEWNLLVPMNKLHLLDSLQEEHKRNCIRSWRNWRFRNKWWISREALGQYWPECKHNAEWNGVEFVGIRLHFHVHCVIVSKYLDNRPVGLWHLDSDGEPMITEDSIFHKEWGGIVDVRSIKDHQVPYNVKGETRKGCGRKACMRYLTKYITKADNWRSVKMGKW